MADFQKKIIETNLRGRGIMRQKPPVNCIKLKYFSRQIQAAADAAAWVKLYFSQSQKHTFREWVA